MNNYRINLDIEMLRGVAIVMVLFQHYPSLYFWSDHSFFSWISQYFTFWTGVDLFFCISGFVVGKTLINKLDESMSIKCQRNIVIKDFFIKRAFRLLPTSIFWAVVVVLLSKHFNNSGAFGIYHENLKQALSVITYNYNWYVKTVNEAEIPATFAPFWSLNLEEQFYFVFPLFLIICPRRFRIALLLTTCAVLFFIKRQGFLSFNFRIDAISYGVILAILSSREEYSRLRDSIRSKVRSPVIITITCVALLIVIPKVLWNTSIMVGVIAFICFFMIYMASINSGEINHPNVIRKPMIYIGNRSYGIYVIHMPSIFITQEIFARHFASQGVNPHGGLLIDFAITIVSIAITWTLVEFNYRIIETPCRKIGASIVARRKIICAC
ncbi:acyltransferase [Rosenbergiella australiborealis]|uniref:Acyltransferase n=1 Tax=Rosenbergiella australiborealis TaxID=1544696 RepID=A0ABS5T0T0_9GAMM|nr:acyltransferase [Rosenbergiella australiborealis]MBT0725949.1 acyltransferase [Rosenbergiella australiborealis]